MEILVPPLQIPKVWEAIKLAVSKTRPEKLSSARMSEYFRGLLLELYSDKAQCFAEIDDQNQVKGILITKIYIDTYGYKVLDLDCLYSFESASIEEWVKRGELILSFAVKKDCDRIVGRTNIPKVIEMAKALGFEEQSTTIVRRLK
jgi:hypothetical protein